MEVEIENGTLCDFEVETNDFECSTRRSEAKRASLRALARDSPKEKFSHSCVALFDWSAARSTRRSNAERANRGEASTRRLRTISSGEKKGRKNDRQKSRPKKRETLGLLN